MMIIDIPSGPLNVAVIRSRRRTSQISIGQDGQVVFRAPAALTDERIERFIRQKTAWIERVRNKMLSRSVIRALPEYKDGGVFFLLGEQRRLCIQKGTLAWPRFEPTLSGWDLFVPTDWDEETVSLQAKRSLELWYRREAETYFPYRLAFWSARMAIVMPTLTLRVQQRLWGSCNSRRHAVNLNRKLIAFPVDVIDYVVIHELCHLRFADHSARFWKEVMVWCPLFRQHREWLKKDALRYVSPL